MKIRKDREMVWTWMEVDYHGLMVDVVYFWYVNYRQFSSSCFGFGNSSEDHHIMLPTNYLLSNHKGSGKELVKVTTVAAVSLHTSQVLFTMGPVKPVSNSMQLRFAIDFNYKTAKHLPPQLV